MTIIFDGTLGITSPGGDTSNTSHSTPIVKSPSALVFQTNGSTEAMRIDTSQNVGINTVNATTGRLVIAQNNATQPAISLPTDESTIQGPSANTQIRMGGNLVLGAAGQVSINTIGSQRLVVDSSGRVTMPSQPSFSAYTDIQRNFNSGAFTPYIFELTRYNIGNNYNTSNGIFTAPVAGRYYFNCWIHWMQESSFNYMFVQPTVNGSPAFEFMRQGDRTDYSTFGGSMILNLSANDQVRMDVVTNGVDSGYARPGSTMNLFEGRLLG